MQLIEHIYTHEQSQNSCVEKKKDTWVRVRVRACTHTHTHTHTHAKKRKTHQYLIKETNHLSLFPFTAGKTRKNNQDNCVSSSCPVTLRVSTSLLPVEWTRLVYHAWSQHSVGSCFCMLVKMGHGRVGSLIEDDPPPTIMHYMFVAFFGLGVISSSPAPSQAKTLFFFHLQPTQFQKLCLIFLL